MDLSPPGVSTDSPERFQVLRQSVADVVRKEADLGVDVISDGEHGKSNWQSYIMERFSGFEAKPVPPHKWSYIGQDLETFADFYRESRPELFHVLHPTFHADHTRYGSGRSVYRD